MTHTALIIQPLSAVWMPIKNIFALIELGKEIQTKNSNIVVNVYGDGKLKGEFQAAIDDNGLHDIIRLRGFEPDKGKIFTENDSLIFII